MVDKILPGLPAPPARFPAHLVTLVCQRRLSLSIRTDTQINTNIGYSAKSAILLFFGGSTAGTLSGMHCTSFSRLIFIILINTLILIR